MRDKISGIYQILNLKNNKVYVGSSTDIESRWSHHKNSLNRGKHHSIHLQNAWNMQKEEDFYFCILEIWAQSFLEEREQFYIDYLKSYIRDFGYNLNPKSNNSVKSPETIEKLRLCMTGRKQSEATILKRILTFKIRGVSKGERNGNFGKVSKNKGKPCSLETIQKNREWHLGRTGVLCPNSKKVYQYNLKGDFIRGFDSVQEACRITGINNIAACCIDKQKSAGKFIWSYIKTDYLEKDITPKWNSKTCEVIKLDKNGMIIDSYPTIKEAKLKNKGDINSALKNGYKTEGQYYWKYKEV